MSEGLPRVLFVDDDPLILTGLGRALRPMQREWAMIFECGGSAGVAAIETQPFDVVVSDMRMPNVDGADLLGVARKRRPGAMRVVLSGQTGLGTSRSYVEVAHRCLSKPCNTSAVIAAIRPALERRALLGDRETAAAVAEVTTLPSRPGTRNRLLAETKRSDASIERLATIVSSDVGMACKVLQMANAATVSDNARPVMGIGAAASRLGIALIRELALSAVELSEYTGPGFMPFVHESGESGDPWESWELWRRSVERRDRAAQVAVAAGQDRSAVDAASTAGLLQDVGRLALVATWGARHGLTPEPPREGHAPAWQVEHDEQGTSHREVGAYLLALWGIPHVIMDTLAGDPSA